MLLYATTTSERASKGQGGNDYLEIEVKINDRVNPRYHIRVNKNTFEVLNQEERVIYLEEHTLHKGKK